MAGLCVKSQILAAIGTAVAAMSTGQSVPVGLVVWPGEEIDADDAAAIQDVVRGGKIAVEVIAGDDEPLEAFGDQSNREVARFTVGLLLHLPKYSGIVLSWAAMAAEAHAAVQRLYAGAAGSWGNLARTTYCAGGGGGPTMDERLGTPVTVSAMVIDYATEVGAPETVG